MKIKDLKEKVTSLEIDTKALVMDEKMAKEAIHYILEYGLDNLNEEKITEVIMPCSCRCSYYYNKTGSFVCDARER